MTTSTTSTTTQPDVSTILLERFGKTRGFRELAARLAEGAEAPISARGLTGSARSLLIATLARQGRTSASVDPNDAFVPGGSQGGAGSPGVPLLVVVPDSTTAEDLKEDLLFLLGPRSAAILPELGLEPYVSRHPRLAVRAGRIELLAALVMPESRHVLTACERLHVVIATGISLSTPLPDPKAFQCGLRRLRVGDEVDYDELAEFLVARGYTAVPMVGEYGDMSRRGGILDVYGFGRENPVRIEFDGDEVASIREFDGYSQRSIANLPEVLLLPFWEWLPDRSKLDFLAANPPAGLDAEPWRDAVDSVRSDGTLEGIEWHLPAFGLERARLADYLDPETTVVHEGPTFVRSRRHGWLADLEEAFEALVRHERDESDPSPFHASFGLPPVAPGSLFWLEEGVRELFPATGPEVVLGSGDLREETGAESQDGSGNGDARDPRQEPNRNGHSVGPDAGRGAGGGDAGQESGSQDGVTAAGPDAGGGDAVRGASSRGHGRYTPRKVVPLPGLDELGGRLIEFHTVPPESFGRNLERTRGYIRSLYDRTPEIHILCDTENHRDRLADVLKQIPASFHVGNLAAGFLVPDEGFSVLTDHEIFSRVRRRTVPRRFARGMSLKELLALNPGDFVVHVEHGIGRYKGMNRLTVDGQETDCLTLEYLGGDVLYVPVDQLMKVQKYSAEDSARPQLSKMGGRSWAKTKAKVKKSIKDMAEELIKTYAVRKSRPGFGFSGDTDLQRELEAKFPYDETPDQMRAIEDVRGDMESESPMDRLICGDVGYGKTEVAIRAAFKAAQDGKQVAMLVPTTLLAQQHYETFLERLKEFPVVVDYLSRFRTGAESREVKERLGKGEIDILIGTHKLLGKGVDFRDLGLLIIDEEQLFGVKAKEKLKKLRETIDVLTLTATPIPRTMHLALMGGRDMSTILTPPRDRRPIQTEIVEFRDDVIAHALMKEADRGGQSFFVHNRVETIDSMANYLMSLCPHLRFAVAHGQMRERALEEVMHAFLAEEYDVLVSTMIIESGLDLPNVNTILINRGDTFGLAQLYQLRGRVGRSARKAYAYLLLPPHRSITEQAQKRLKAMEEFEDLGSGYQLAMRDLEIRGAGDLLGSQQSGFIISVGFELYCQLLEEAVNELRGVRTQEYVEPKMSTDIEAYLPEEYVPDPREKINLYKSLADARDLEKVEKIAAELADRFGKHPDPVRHLLGLRRIRILGTQVGVEKITVRESLVQLDMGRDLKKDELRRFVQSVPFQVEFLLHGRHRIRLQKPGSGEAVSSALILLRALAGAEEPAEVSG